MNTIPLKLLINSTYFYLFIVMYWLYCLLYMGLGCVLVEYVGTFFCSFCCLFSAREFKKTLNKI